MRFVVDQQLPPALAAWLVSKGHEAVHVRDLGMRQAEDSDIWRHAAQNGLTVVTKDSDFAERRSRVGRGPTILWLRIGNTTTPALLEILQNGWSAAETALASGAEVVEVR